MNNYEKANKEYYEALTKAYDAYYNSLNGINVKKNEKIVLKCKTDYCFYFARDIPGADIKAHEQVILKIKNPEYCYKFAKDIPGADIKAHEQVILELKDPEFSYYFAKNISGVNMEEHFKVIFNSGDKFLLDCFIEEINYKGTKIEEWLLYI